MSSSIEDFSKLFVKKYSFTPLYKENQVAKVFALISNYMQQIDIKLWQEYHSDNDQYKDEQDKYGALLGGLWNLQQPILQICLVGITQNSLGNVDSFPIPCKFVESTHNDLVKFIGEMLIKRKIP